MDSIVSGNPKFAMTICGEEQAARQAVELALTFTEFTEFMTPLMTRIHR